MENYIVINGKKAELTEEQLKALGIPTTSSPFGVGEGKKTAIFTDDLGGTGVIAADTYKCDRMAEVANIFNDNLYAYQVALHQTLNRQLLKYAYEHNAADVEWNGKNPHYYILLDTENNSFHINSSYVCKTQDVCFSNIEVARAAIDDVVKPFMKKYSNFVW